MRANHEPYDEESLEHNDLPVLAVSQWQRWGEWDGYEDYSCDPRFDLPSLPKTDTESVNPDPK